jgi:hypothetical protein
MTIVGSVRLGLLCREWLGQQWLDKGLIARAQNG